MFPKILKVFCNYYIYLKFIFSIDRRNKQNILDKYFSIEIDQENIDIIRESIIDKSIKIYNSHISGDPHNKVDIAIIGEGYTKEEENKFKSDLKNHWLPK